jgi:predicted nucleic acid-binding protein
VFADTSGLYALLVVSEEGHPDVKKSFSQVLTAGRVLSTTSYVIVETVALLQSRIGMGAARDFSERIVPLLSIEWVSSVLHGTASRRHLAEDRRQLSLVDCVSFEYMRSAGIEEALALDQHFEEAGFRLLPRPRPRKRQR